LIAKGILDPLPRNLGNYIYELEFFRVTIAVLDRYGVAHIDPVALACLCIVQTSPDELALIEDAVPELSVDLRRYTVGQLRLEIRDDKFIRLSMRQIRWDIYGRHLRGTSGDIIVEVS